jgi:hypothetical protein
MNDTSETNTIKRGRGRPKKATIDESGEEASSTRKVGLPIMIEPTEHDIRDELSYLDSYTYSRYNE